MVWLILPATIASLVLAAFHLVGSEVFAAWLRRQETATPDAKSSEKLAILVASRGFDPSLPQMLRGLLEQNYPSYEVHVTVDESEGPAREKLSALIADHPQRSRLKFHPLGEPLETCGLKNSALLVGISQLSPDVKRIAMIDTDIIPPPNWLSDLNAYLDDAKIGAVSGAQWFEPGTNFQPGTLVRSLWNAAAVVPTCMFANAWAGSLAFRRASFEESGLPKLWQRTIVDDGPLPEAMRTLGLEMKFARNMFMINRESCSFGYVNNWLTRMLCWSKLYEASFRNTLVHAILTAAILLSLVLAAVASVVTGNWSGLLIVFGSVAFGNVLYVLAWSRVRRAIASATPAVAAALSNSPSPAIWLGLWAFVPITQAAFCLATFRVLGLRTIRWRGVEYQITSPTEVRLIRRGSISQATDSRKTSI